MGLVRPEAPVAAKDPTVTPTPVNGDAQAAARRDVADERSKGPVRPIARPELRWPASWWRPRTRRYQRLAAAIETGRVEIDNRKGLPPAEGASGTTNWRAGAETLLDMAEAALLRGHYSRGWHDVAAADRLQILDYGADELKAFVAALQQEAKMKTTSWRRDAIIALLSPSGGIDPTGTEARGRVTTSKEAQSGDASAWQPSHAAVSRAAMLRDEHAENVYRKVENLSVQLVTLGAILVAAVVLVLALALRLGLPLGKLDPSGPPILLFVVLFGLLGGSISAARSVMRTPLDARVPDQLASWYVVALRPLVGAAAAVAAFILLQGGFIASLQQNGAVTLAVAFAAGFSQELIVGAVATLARGKKESSS